MATREDFTSSAGTRGLCPVCDRRFLLTKKGVLRHHGGGPGTSGYAGFAAYRCKGAGQPPKEGDTE